MKSLEKDRDRRYETASGFAADVQRYLGDEPIEARPPSRTYRFRKFARRNKVAMITAGLVAASLLLGILLTTWQAIRATREGVRATQEAERATRAEQELLDKYDTLASMYTDQKEYAYAEKVYSQLARASRSALGSQHPDTLEARHRLAEVLQKQNRQEDAMRILEEVLADQRKILGPEHPATKQTAVDLSSAYCELSRQLSAGPGGSPVDLPRALEMARRAVATKTSMDDQTSWSWFMLAFTQSRSGQPKAALESLKRSFALKMDWGFQWFLLAAVHAQLGHEQLARDWLAAACNRWKCWSYPRPGTSYYRLIDCAKTEATTLLGLPGDWQPTDLTVTQFVELYTRLAQQEPRLAWLFQQRGRFYGRQGDWERAAADYARAADLQPGDVEHREAHAVVSLFAGDSQTYKAVCRRALEELGERRDLYDSAWLVQLCTLSPLAEVDLEKVSQIADWLYSQRAVGAQALAQGTVAYRRGHFHGAINVIPEEYDHFTPISLAFRAMAYYKIGNRAQAQHELKRAQLEMEQRRPSLGHGATLRPHGSFNPVFWCKAHIVLREAEDLIDSQTDHSQDGTDH